MIAPKIAVATIFLVICLIQSSNGQKEVKVLLDLDATFDCSKLSGDVEFFIKKAANSNETESVVTQISASDKYKIDGKNLTVAKLDASDIEASYFCKSNNGETFDFETHVKLHIAKPIKQMISLVEGGNIKLKCALMYHSPEKMKELSWKWIKTKDNNSEELAADDKKFSIESDSQDSSVLTIRKVTFTDDGSYSCLVKGQDDEHSEEFSISVKGVIFSLMPFLLTILEVAVLCFIVLITEKFLSKRNLAAEEDEEEKYQASNL